MENIIFGLLKSSHDKKVKLSLIERIVSNENFETGFHLDLFYHELESYFATICDDMLKADEAYSICVAALSRIIKITRFLNEYKTLFTVNYINNLFEQSSYQENFIAIWIKFNIQIGTQNHCFNHELLNVLVRQLLSFMRHIAKDIQVYIRFVEILELLQALFNIILTNGFNNNEFFKQFNEYSQQIVKIFIDFLAIYKLHDTNGLKAYLANTNRLIKFTIGFMNKNDALYKYGIDNLVNNLSSNESPNHLAELFKMLDLLKANRYIQTIVLNMEKQEPYDFDVKIKNILQNMIRLISWPFYDKMHLWTCELIKIMIYLNRSQILIQVCEEKFEFLLQNCIYTSTRMASLNLVIVFLVNYQHSPKLFHSNIEKLRLCLEKLKSENDINSFDTLACACLFCIRLFSGQEDLYEPLNKIIKVKLNDEQLKEFGLKFLIDYQAQIEQYLPLNNLNEVSKLPPKQDHVSGLVNFGNTCYLNCIVQALYSCKKFTNLILQQTPYQDSNYLNQLKRLFAFIYFTKRQSIQAREFIDKCIPSWFLKGQQQDSSEYLMFLLDNINEEFKKHSQQTATSVIQDLFSFKTQIEVVCLNCMNKTCTEDTSFILPLSFPQLNTDNLYESIDLKILFDNYFKPEQLTEEDNNLYSCSKCASLQKATRTVKLSQTSDYFIVTLNRFHNTNNQSKKIMNQLENIESINVTSGSYDLQVIVVHAGNSLNHGHYYSYVHHVANNWLVLNDDYVSTINLIDLMQNLKKFKDDTPYILFYRRQNLNNGEENIQLEAQIELEIKRDNEQYEQELQNRPRTQAQTSSTVYGPHNKPNDDDDNWPDTNQSSNNLTGPRIVY